MSNSKMHDHEVDIDLPLVRQLLRVQFPQWAKLSIKQVQSAGTDNAIYRLGADMCVRLPRIPEAARHIEKDQSWLSRFAKTLPLSIPVLIRKGYPDFGYPWHWSIYP